MIDRLVSGGAALVAMTDSADGRARIVVPATLVWLSTGWNVSFTPSLGAVDALIASGRLAQIENPKLRQGLAGLKDVFNDAFEEEVFAREISVGQIVPLIGARVPLDFRIGRELFTSDGDGLTPQERSRGRPLPSYGSVEFPTDLAVRNAIVYRLAWLSAARSEFDHTHAHLEDLTTMVAAEIGVSNPGRPRR